MACRVAVHECATWRSVGAASGKAVSDALHLPDVDQYLELAQPHYDCLPSEADWAPNGRLVLHKALLYAGGTLQGPHGGRFAIVDALQGCLLAVMTLDIRPRTWFLSGFGWHPSSGGVVHAAQAWALGPGQVQKLQAATLAVGSLPEPYSAVLGLGGYPSHSNPGLDYSLVHDFSPCGQLLLASALYADEGGHVIFACIVQGLRYTFQQVFRFDGTGGVQSLAWLPVPGIPACLVARNSRMLSLVTPRGVFLGKWFKAHGGVLPGSCSPSGDSFIGEGDDAFLWLHFASGGWERLRENPRIWSPQGCLLLQPGCIKAHQGPFSILHYEDAFVEEVWEEVPSQEGSEGSVGADLGGLFLEDE